jgi:hypothetical protein
MNLGGGKFTDSPRDGRLWGREKASECDYDGGKNEEEGEEEKDADGERRREEKRRRRRREKRKVAGE